jgi:transcriptional regulator with AAA-type ATPase domain
MHTLDISDRGWSDEVRRDLLDDPVEALVIRHVDRLVGDAAGALAAVLHEVRAQAGGDAPWLAVTVASDIGTNPDLTELQALFPRTVPVPPLRRRIEDLSELVPLLLSKLARGGDLTCSPAAMHLLKRANWPANTAQLYQVLKQVAQRRRTGSIQPTDLPAEFRTATRRSLNRLETIERDAIVQGLEDAAGNKLRAAKLLGMSRATIYRKIHEYGILT